MSTVAEWAVVGVVVWVGMAYFTMWFLGQPGEPPDTDVYIPPLPLWREFVSLLSFIVCWPMYFWIAVVIRWEKRG